MLYVSLVRERRGRECYLIYECVALHSISTCGAGCNSTFLPQFFFFNRNLGRKRAISTLIGGKE